MPQQGGTSPLFPHGEVIADRISHSKLEAAFKSLSIFFGGVNPFDYRRQLCR
jgi:hypothetical protein